MGSHGYQKNANGEYYYTNEPIDPSYMTLMKYLVLKQGAVSVRVMGNLGPIGLGGQVIHVSDDKKYEDDKIYSTIREFNFDKALLTNPMQVLKFGGRC